MPVIPASWEVEIGESWSEASLGQKKMKKNKTVRSYLKEQAKYGCYVPVITAIWEAQVRRLQSWASTGDLPEK
jgi:hypothetical protein